MPQGDQKMAAEPEEIGFMDILDFIADHWKMILGTGIAGAALAGGYLVLSEPEYEASALVRMAQFRAGTAEDGGFIESPALLIERLKIPTTYSPEALRACGLDGQAESPPMRASSLVKAVMPKDLSSVAILTVRQSSPALAKHCVVGIYEMIREQQAALIKPYKDEERRQLAVLQSRQRENQEFITDMEKSPLYQAAFLAKRDEMLYLAHRIDELAQSIAWVSPTSLLAPAYVSDQPVQLKLRQTLFMATMGGLMLGLLLALGWKLLGDWRASRGAAKAR